MNNPMVKGSELIRDCLRRVVAGENFQEEEAFALMDDIMRGEASEAQIGALLVALRIKGETVEEVTGFARAMRANAVRLNLGLDDLLVDTCGTGGDACDTFNISTAAALVAAGAGIKIAKHGNRSVSSSCGSADVMEAMGVKIDAEPEIVARCIKEAGIGFLFAPKFHPAMKFAIGPRREISLRTVFNVLGPLTNPAGARAQVLGVFAPELTDPLAHVLLSLGTERALVVHGLEGMDEISLTGPTKVSEVVAGEVRNYTFAPEEAGYSRCEPEELSGGSIGESVEMLQLLLTGEKGSRRDAVVLNAGAALLVGGKATSIGEGAKLAEGAIDSGRAKKTLEKLIEVSNS